jgi:hypothetical protein
MEDIKMTTADILEDVISLTNSLNPGSGYRYEIKTVEKNGINRLEGYLICSINGVDQVIIRKSLAAAQEGAQEIVTAQLAGVLMMEGLKASKKEWIETFAPKATSNV